MVALAGRVDRFQECAPVGSGTRSGVGRPLTVRSLSARQYYQATKTICFDGAAMGRLIYAALKGMEADLSKVTDITTLHNEARRLLGIVGVLA